jgi:hypothetical protein
LLIIIGACTASLRAAAAPVPDTVIPRDESAPDVSPPDVTPPDVAPAAAEAPAAVVPLSLAAPEPGAPAAAPSDTPIELDVSLTGETRAARASDDRGRSHLEGLVLLSAADGVGLGGQLRSGMFGFRGTVAYQPLLFLVDADPADKTFGAFEFSNSIQLNVDVLLVGTETEKGGSLGYRFNDLLGHGISVAYQATFDAWGQHFSLSFPVTYYPGATGRVRDKLGIASDYEINFPFGAGLQFGMGAAWIL